MSGDIETREQRLRRARELSAKISGQTEDAGITSKELEDRAYEAFEQIRKERSSLSRSISPAYYPNDQETEELDDISKRREGFEAFKGKDLEE